MLFKVSNYRKLSSPITFAPRWLMSEVSPWNQCFCPDRPGSHPQGRQMHKSRIPGKDALLAPEAQHAIFSWIHLSFLRPRVSIHSSPGSAASCSYEVSAANPPLLIP